MHQLLMSLRSEETSRLGDVLQIKGRSRVLPMHQFLEYLLWRPGLRHGPFRVEFKILELRIYDRVAEFEHTGSCFGAAISQTGKSA